MRNQSESITELERKREALIGLTNYTREDLDMTCDKEIECIYEEVIKELNTQ